LMRVPAGGGVPTTLTTLDAARREALHMLPAFLPDGRHYVFSSVGGDRGGVYLGVLDSAERTLLVPDAGAIGVSEPDRIFFVQKHKLMTQRVDVAGRKVVGDPILVAENIATSGPTPAAAVSPRGDIVYWSGIQDTTQLTWMTRDGTAAGLVGSPGPFMNVAISPDGRQAAVDHLDTDSGIWIVDLVRGTTTRATFGETYESTPVWSPDSKTFAFAAAHQAPPNLFMKRLDAQVEERRLVESTIQSFPQSWSRDGLIAFTSIDNKTRGDIWVVPASGEQPPRPILQTTFAETHARISPDGRWLAYDSNESGRPEVYVTAFPQPGAKWPISVDGGAWPVWRADSRELYYRAPGGRLMAVGITAEREFKAGLPMPLFQLRTNTGGLGAGTFYDVAADGRFLVNVFVDRTIPPAAVILHWTQAAR
ncbi:MAG TPA: hypothetical protein VFV98_13130, partial [Vicinamibacterales bacterium]|nr:hypothetical protein [Vicinamibacterales bacterium]